jgi:hypothetical protein
MPSHPEEAVPDSEETLSAGPTDAEIEAWAERERVRREAWLRGPSQTQKAEWAVREHARRTGKHLPLPTSGADTRRLAQHYLRDVQLVAEGAMSMLFNLSVRDMFDELIRHGREWEDEYTRGSAPRRRVPLEDEPSKPRGQEPPGVSSQPT